MKEPGRTKPGRGIDRPPPPPYNHPRKHTPPNPNPFPEDIK